MKSYKISALNRYFKYQNLPYKLASSSSSDPHILLNIKNIPIYARLASTPHEVQQGLMGVTHLDANEGCLLDFGFETPANLWMKNCKINLQAATIDNAGTIIDILDMDYQDPYRIHRSSRPVRYALEMNQDFFSKYQIKPGDKIRI